MLISLSDEALCNRHYCHSTTFVIVVALMHYDYFPLLGFGNIYCALKYCLDRDRLNIFSKFILLTIRPDWRYIIMEIVNP